MFTVLLCVLAHRKGLLRPKWNGAICVRCASPTKRSTTVWKMSTPGPWSCSSYVGFSHQSFYHLHAPANATCPNIRCENFFCCSGVAQFIWNDWLSCVFLWTCSMYHEGLFMDISHSRHLDSSTQVHVNMTNGLSSIQVCQFQEPGVVHSGLLGHVNRTEPSLMLLIARGWLRLWSTLWLQRNSNSALRSHKMFYFLL